jgi:pimeloyl-ACP methyl ester carboxylesterase
VPFVEVENGRLYYDVSGKGRPLVLIHGAWVSHEWWRWQVPELSCQYQVLSLDVRGHGQSSPLQGAYSVVGFTRDIEIFFQKVGIEEAALIGWSMGGMISMQYCLNHPSKVKALVLISTRGHRNPYFKLKVLFHHLQARLSLMVNFTSPRKYDRAAHRFPDESRAWLKREVSNMLSPTVPKQVFDWVIAELTNKPRENYLEIAKSIWSWEAGEELRRINVSTLIMAGEKDSWMPTRFSHLLHSTIPNSRLVIVENTGHYLSLERPETVNTEIIKFLKGLGY